MNINLEYYKVFITIAKNKNITKAANELNISQPAISKMLKTMEGQICKKLFIRENKGVVLSKEWIELYNLISNEINNIIKAKNVFSRIISNNEIKIAIHPTVLNYFINSLYQSLYFIDIGYSFIYVIFPLASFYFLFQAVLNFFLVLANLRA